MSVAVQTASDNGSEKIPRSAESQLAWSSLLGALFLLGSLFLVLSFLPTIWHQAFAGVDAATEILNPFLSGALLLMVSIAAIVGLGYLGYWLDKNYSLKGLRAGSVFGAIAIFAIIWITYIVASALEAEGTLGFPVCISITLLVAGGLLFGLSQLFLFSGTRAFLVAVEDQGWFYVAAFKPNQGHKVRRATIAGILAIGICGIYTMVDHKLMGTGIRANDWVWWIPFSGTTVPGPMPDSPTQTVYHWVILIYRLNIMVPFLLSLVLLWFAWRVTNWPAFADFLIATEAEINKVSWTTRKRLVTDTIVVLVTVFLLTAYLFAMDFLWIQILSNRLVPVLFVDVRAEQAKQNEKTLW